MNRPVDKILLHQIAERVKTLREARGLSQQQVYFDTNIHIGRIETARLNITVSTLKILCDYFEMDLATFFGPFAQD